MTRPKSAGIRDGTFYDNPTEYVTEYCKGKLRDSLLSTDGKRSGLLSGRLPGLYGFSEDHIAGGFPAAAGASASAATGPIDVCNSLTG